MREMLAETHLASNRHADAAPILRDLYEARVRGGASDALLWGLRLLASRLEARQDDALADLIVNLAATAPPDSGDSTIVQTIATYLDSTAVVADPQRTRSVLDILKALAPETLGEPLRSLIARIEPRLTSTTPVPPSEPG